MPLPDVVVNRSSPVPLYFQVAEQIERAIFDGKLAPGDRIANEVALADQLGLSRPTVRQAIQTLVDKGLLVRKRGVGTQVVNAPEVTVQNVSRQVEVAPAALPPRAPELARAGAPAEASAPAERESDTVVVDLGAASGVAVAPPRARVEKMADATQPARDTAVGTMADQAPPPAVSAAPTVESKPDYRRDSKTWLAEIERLRASGDAARADAELAEYKREHRAYAVAPDR